MPDNQQLNIRQIINRVRQKAINDGGTQAPSAYAQDDSSTGIRPAFFQGAFLDVDRDSFNLHEFLSLHDRTFVIAAYQSLLKRDPDPEGLDHYLHLLRSGKVDKIYILASFRFGSEGRKKKVRVKGLTWEVFKLILKTPPVIGGGVDYLLALLGLRRIRADLVKNEREIGRLFEETGLALARIEAGIESRLSAKADKDQLENKADLREMDQYMRSVNQVFDMICTLNDPVASEPENKERLTGLDAYASPWLDNLYVSFEDAFRGPREIIRERLAIYLPEVRAAVEQIPSIAAVEHIKPDCRVLDLGCGRGEFLDLLAGNGIVGLGVDSNAVMVHQGRERGYDVRKDDIFEFLGKLPDHCMGVVTAFQVLEHLPFERQLMLIDQCRRILTPRGLLILETPNPQNILAGSVDFHRDPTHLRPIHPDTLLFLAKNRGFVKSRIGIARQNDDTLVLQNAAEMSFGDFTDYLTVARDYALLAYKP